MMEYLIVFLVAVGSIFILIASVGMLRMPDLYMRMSSTTKAATLGVGGILFAAAIFFFDEGISTRTLAIIIFLFLTSPVAAHIIGRAGYFVGCPMWEKTKMDELKGKYNPTTHALEGEEQVKK